MAQLTTMVNHSQPSLPLPVVNHLFLISLVGRSMVVPFPFLFTISIQPYSFPLFQTKVQPVQFNFGYSMVLFLLKSISACKTDCFPLTFVSLFDLVIFLFVRLPLIRFLVDPLFFSTLFCTLTQLPSLDMINPLFNLHSLSIFYSNLFPQLVGLWFSNIVHSSVYFADHLQHTSLSTFGHLTSFSTDLTVSY